MRLFIAILFEENVKSSLYKAMEGLHKVVKSGSFTAQENLHLTVNFIGETKRLEEVKKAMHQAINTIKPEKFRLTIRDLGKFKRREGDIYWLGVEREDTLWRLQKELVKELKEAGFFDIDDMEYTPHLTIGRRIVLANSLLPENIEMGMLPLQMEVAKISLMESERINGKLVYTEIYQVGLRENNQ